MTQLPLRPDDLDELVKRHVLISICIERGFSYTRQQLAEEIGIKFRFLAEGQLLKTFLGGRIGVRASGSNPIEHARLIFEVGAGSW